MVFSSALFLYIFAPVFFFVYFLAPRASRNWLILIANLVFYAAGAGLVTFSLLFSIWGNHFIALRLARPEQRNRRALLWIGVVLNFAGLIYYKYTGFLWLLADDVLQASVKVSIGPAPFVLLPIGVSFFTFQAISYLVDIYRGETAPAKSYSEFAMYHSLFPQLVAGPIVRYREIAEQIYNRPIVINRLGEGGYRFCIGLGKKIILADSLATVTDQILKLPADQLTCAHAWLAMFCYSLQIYLDFSGYSDMAIGLGKMLGFDFPENFDQPYRAHSVTEFWRRWHMTLTRWFRDYVYIPLGGNRSGGLRTFVNLWVVFCLCGLWHGAGLNFLIWGLYHGTLLVFERALRHRFGWTLNGVAGTAATLILVTIGWVFFRVETWNAAVTTLRAMVGLGVVSGPVEMPVGYYLAPDILFYLAIALVVAFVPAGRLGQWQPERTGVLAAQLFGALAVFCYSALLLAANSFNPFIYFRF